MSEKVLLIILILFIGFYFLFSSNRPKAYFFLNKDDDKSLEMLNNILRNSDIEIIIINYDGSKDNLVELNKIINTSGKSRTISKILNVEKMSDLNQVIFDTCYRNAKCINQPSNKFYEIYNRLNVFGYPFEFENNYSELLQMPDRKVNNLIDVSKNPTCGRPGEVVLESPPWQRKRGLNY